MLDVIETIVIHYGYSEKEIQCILIKTFFFSLINIAHINLDKKIFIIGNTRFCGQNKP